MAHVDGHRSRRRPFTVALITALALAVSLAISAPAGSSAHHSVARRQIAHERGTFDVRSRGSAAVVGTRTAVARASLARTLGAQGVISSDPFTGTPRMIGRLDGFLTRPSRRPAARVTMGFVRSHLATFGLSRADLRTFHLRQDYVDIGGTHHVSWTQSVRGITVFHNGLRASVTRDGRLVNVTGSPVHAPRPNAPQPRLSAAAAIRAARANGGAHVRAAQRGDSAALTLFPTGRGTRLAWRTLTWPSTQRLNLSVVDAIGGRVLYRQGLTSDADGTATAWEFYPSDLLPAGANTANPVTFPVQDGTGLFGANAWVYADVNDNNNADKGEEIPAVGGTDWSISAVLDASNAGQNCTTARPCTWDKKTPFSWTTNMAQNATQVMYYLNKYHDHLASSPYGFTASAGNFELAGGDPVIGNSDDGANTNNGLPDGSHTDNANMSTPPDGYPPLMQMYLFKAYKDLLIPTANGGDDAEVVYHEYTHGLSNRLVVFPDGNSGLTTYQANSMGEGWSDWYAEDFLNDQGFKPDTPAVDVVMGDITFGGFLRFQPVDCPVDGSASVCPGGQSTGAGGFTYGDFGNVYPGDVHSDGEIWLETLWQIRQAVGAATAETLVTRGMELSPPGPSFLDMRNAILQADLVNFGGANQATLWTVFAQRGMGYFASSTGVSLDPTADSSLPVDCSSVPCGSISGTLTNKATGKPIAGAHVGIAGLDSGFASDLAADTDASGDYAIANVPFHSYGLLSITAPGYESVVVKNLNVAGDQTLDRKLVRDWASLEGGAKLGKFSPPDYSDFGCGPGGLFDNSLGSGWGSDAVGSDVGSHYTGPRKIVVKLAKAVNISSFALASNGTCGDGPAAGVNRFQIQTKTKNGDWVTAVSGNVDNDAAFHVFKPHAGTKHVVFVRFIMKSNHGDKLFMDVLELSVRGK